MTITALNNPTLDPSNAPAPAQQKANPAISAEQEFLQTLQSSLNFSTTGMTPAITTALAGTLNRPTPLPSDHSRSTNNNASGQPTQSTAQNNAPAPVDAPAPTQQAAAPSQAPQSSDTHTTTSSSKDDTATSNAPAATTTDTSAATDAAAQVQGQVLAAAFQTQAQTVQTSGGPVQQTVADTNTNADQNPFDWLDKMHGASIAQLTQQITSDTSSGPVVQNAGPAVDTTETSGNGKSFGIAAGLQNQGPVDPVQAQADTLAQSLNGTGAAISVSVKVTGPAITQVATDDTAAQAAQAVPQQPVDTAPVSLAATPAVSSQAQGAQDDAAAAQAAENAQVQAQVVEQTTAAVTTAAVTHAAAAEAPAAEPTPITGVGATQSADAAQKTSAPAAARAPQPSSQLEQKEILDQISVQINKAAANGNDTIKVNLKPVELGRIEIKLEMGNNGQVTATVTADNPNTLAMLQKNSADLSKSLSDAGLQANAGSLNFNLRGDQQQQQTTNDDGSRAQRRRALASMDTGDLPAIGALAQSRAAGIMSGVNIQV